MAHNWSKTSSAAAPAAPASNGKMVTSHVTPTAAISDIGIYVDVDTSLTAYVTKTVCCAVLRLHRSIRQLVSRYILHFLVLGPVTAGLRHSVVPARSSRSMINFDARLVYYSSSKYRLLLDLSDISSPALAEDSGENPAQTRCNGV